MTLALIAGRGRLPRDVAAAQDAAPLICGYEGMLPDRVEAELTFRLETLGTLLVSLGERGITQVCFCGAIDRPTLDPNKLDAETLPLVPCAVRGVARCADAPRCSPGRGGAGGHGAAGHRARLCDRRGTGVGC